MAEPRWKWKASGYVTADGEWTPWHKEQYTRWKGMNDGTWIHILESHCNEPNPDANHIHYKFKSGEDQHSSVLCSIKVDGMREVNRRELIEAINRITGLNLKYR